MKELIGSPGKVGGLLLRMGQCLFAAASIAAMASAKGFSNYTAFCYLIASMGLQVLWSFGLACLDAYALRIKRDLKNPVLLSLFVVGDWVTATLSLAAACSSAGVAVLYARDFHFCKGQIHSLCNRFQLSIALAFVTWFLIAISSHIMFWMLASHHWSHDFLYLTCKRGGAETSSGSNLRCKNSGKVVEVGRLSEKTQDSTCKELFCTFGTVLAIWTT